MSAVLSEDRRYRYRLRREAGGLLGEGVALFIMLNPSTADEAADDPTIRRCCGFVRRWGYGALEVVNLFALRATDPAALYADADPVGPENDSHISAAAADAKIIVAAWGVHGTLYGRGPAVRDLLQGQGRRLTALGVTKDGQPRHPLYMPLTANLRLV